MKELRDKNGLTEAEAIARYRQKNYPKPALTADIAVFDLSERFTVDPKEFVSKGKSSPFTGMELWGVTELTVCAGNIVYRRK